MSAVAAVAERAAMHDIASLGALYEEAARVGFTAEWVPRKKPILWGGAQVAIRAEAIGAGRTPRPPLEAN